MSEKTPAQSDWPRALVLALRGTTPLLLALALVGMVLGGLLVGYEPVGGDPDRLYRPLKSELARALGEGRLPFWSPRFGLGVPLVAESHVAAFYPPNLVLYGLFDVSAAYRLSMWLHYVAVVATTYLYARCLGLTAWGSALAGVAFAFCGFQTIHSSHEPFYCLMPYLPLALFVTERYMSTGRFVWVAILAICLALQWSVGHFQIQMWTNALVIVTGLWRAFFDGRSARCVLGLIAGTGWGAALAAVQLGLSWQFANSVGQTQRSPHELFYYSFPPLHWFELALPRLVRELRLGPEDPYWFGQQTWGYEAALYVGTIPLVFAFLGVFGWPFKRATLLWVLLAPISFALATMPRWWPQGYLSLLALPGFGYFRVPARYTLLTSLGLAMLSGDGLDRSISKMSFRVGFAAALFFGGCAAVAAFRWTERPDVQLASSLGGIPGGFLWAGLTWSVALVAVAAWRLERLGPAALLFTTAIELGILFYMGTTVWGWAVALPDQSPVLSELLRQSPAGLIAGETENLPVRADLATGYPYLGLAHPYPNRVLVLAQQPLVRGDSTADVDNRQAVTLRRWLRRCRVTYVVGSRRSILALGDELGRWRDPALDKIIYRRPSDPSHRIWSIVRLDDPLPEARVARRARTSSDRGRLIDRLSQSDELDVAWFLAEDAIPARPDAESARLVSWDGAAATIEHVGPCDLIIARTFDAGWLARVDDGPEQSASPVDGGFLAVRLEGSGTHRVALRYRPPRITLFATISLFAAALVAATLCAELVARLRPRVRAARSPGVTA
jgi:hypothetical protein